MSVIAKAQLIIFLKGYFQLEHEIPNYGAMDEMYYDFFTRWTSRLDIDMVFHNDLGGGGAESLHIEQTFENCLKALTDKIENIKLIDNILQTDIE